jgi:hypothetical protein
MCVYHAINYIYDECTEDHIKRCIIMVPWTLPDMDEDTKKQVNCDKEKDPETNLCASAIERAPGSKLLVLKGPCVICDELYGPN